MDNVPGSESQDMENSEQNKLNEENKNNLIHAATIKDDVNYKTNFIGVFGIKPKEKSNQQKDRKTSDQESKAYLKSSIKSVRVDLEKDKNPIAEDIDKKDVRFSDAESQRDNNSQKTKKSGESSKKISSKKSSKNCGYSFADNIKDKALLLDGEGNSYEIIFQRKDYEISMSFNENFFKSSNDIHFTLDYFSFPQFYMYKVKYAPDTKITTVKLKDYRSFKFQTKDKFGF